MGKLEGEIKRRIRRTAVQEFVLACILGNKTATFDMLLSGVLKSMDISALPISRRQPEIIKSAASRLRKRGLVTLKDNHYQLTERGAEILKTWQTANYKIEKPRRWDGRWRIVIFDISEKRKRVRDRVRRILSSAGFYRLQDSVWVHPYDCEDVIGLLKQNLGISRDVLYIIAEQIENDRYLRQEFGLLP